MSTVRIGFLKRFSNTALPLNRDHPPCSK